MFAFISAYHHSSCEFESCSWRCVLDTALRDKVCQWLVAVGGFLQVLWCHSQIKLTATI